VTAAIAVVVAAARIDNMKMRNFTDAKLRILLQTGNHNN
jgi:hypothetical protein